jgi:hypothetical protein
MQIRPLNRTALKQDILVVVLISFFGAGSSYVPTHERSIYQSGVLWDSSLRMELDLNGGSYVSSSRFSFLSVDKCLTNSLSSQKWEVYVDQSKQSLERGASATLDAFVGLSPPEVRVIPAILAKQKGTKAKGPIVRCIPIDDQKDSLEASNVDSVDKVYRILTRHMRIPVSL